MKSRRSFPASPLTTTPRTPMALAPVAYCIWQRFLRFDPDDLFAERYLVRLLRKRRAEDIPVD